MIKIRSFSNCLFFFIVFLAMLSMISCQKQQDVCYSCDSEIDAFVKANKEQLLHFNLTDLTLLELEKQKAAYRSYNAIKKSALWKEKYKFILDNADNLYNQEELKEIRVLYDFISPDIVENREEILLFVEEWFLRTKEKFSWSDNRYRFLFFSLEFDETAFLAREVDPKPTVYCNCNDKHSGILIEDCPSIMPDCRKVTTCEATDSGCGYIWIDKCNGDCFFENEPT